MEALFLLLIVYMGLIYKMFTDSFSRVDNTEIHEDYYLEAIEKMNNIEFEEHSIINQDNLRLAARYYKVDNPERIVLAVHGYKGFGIKDMGVFADLYLNNKCNYFVIDHRGHYSSEGKYITMGAKEKYDLKEWIEYINSVNSDNLPIYLAGVSMGTASCLQCIGMNLPENVMGVIADCGFTNAKEVLKKVMKDTYKTDSGFIIDTANLYCKIVGGFDLVDSDTKYALNKTRIPVVFIHGLADGFVPSYMSEENYSICNSEKEIHLFEGADHCISYLSDNERYEEIVLNFFEKTKKRS